MQREPVQDMKDPITEELDENQNTLANINLGLSNYSYLKRMQKVGKLLIKRKKDILKQKKIKSEKKKDLLQLRIDINAKKAVEEKLKVDQYKAKTDPRPIYIFLQFQSMNGKEKFLKAINVSTFKRFWMHLCCFC